MKNIMLLIMTMLLLAPAGSALACKHETTASAPRVISVPRVVAMPAAAEWVAIAEAQLPAVDELRALVLDARQNVFEAAVVVERAGVEPPAKENRGGVVLTVARAMGKALLKVAATLIQQIV